MDYLLLIYLVDVNGTVIGYLLLMKIIIKGIVGF